MTERNAASVLPEPVGASTSVDSPRAMGGQPSACARVGAPNAARKYARVGSENNESGSTRPSVADLARGAAERLRHMRSAMPAQAAASAIAAHEIAARAWERSRASATAGSPQRTVGSGEAWR